MCAMCAMCATCEMMVQIKADNPGARIEAMGISAGSGLLASYLGEASSESLISSAVCLAPGYDAKELFQAPIAFPYGTGLTNSLVKLYKWNALELSKVNETYSLI